MTDILGDGEFRYRVDTDWGRLPTGLRLGDVAAIAVGTSDEFYLFNRGETPMVVLDRNGAFLRSWGEGILVNPHGLHIGPDNHLYCTDDGDHTVRKCMPEGKVVLTLGIPGRPAPKMSGVLSAAAPTRRSRRRGTFTFPTATPTRASTNTYSRFDCVLMG